MPDPQTDVRKKQDARHNGEDRPHWIDHDQGRNKDSSYDSHTLHTSRDQIDLLDAVSTVHICLLLEPGLHLATCRVCQLISTQGMNLGLTNVASALEEHISEHNNVKVPVSKYALQHALADLRTLLGTLALHAGNSQLALVLCQPPDLGAGGQTRVQEKTCNADRERDAPIDDKEPSPARHAHCAVQAFVCCGLQIATEHGTGVTRDVPDTSALEDLVRAVPGRE